MARARKMPKPLKKAVLLPSPPVSITTPTTTTKGTRSQKKRKTDDDDHLSREAPTKKQKKVTTKSSVPSTPSAPKKSAKKKTTRGGGKKDVSLETYRVGKEEEEEGSGDESGGADELGSGLDTGTLRVTRSMAKAGASLGDGGGLLTGVSVGEKGKEVSVAGKGKGKEKKEEETTSSSKRTRKGRASAAKEKEGEKVTPSPKGESKVETTAGGGEGIKKKTQSAARSGKNSKNLTVRTTQRHVHFDDDDHNDNRQRFPATPYPSKPHPFALRRSPRFTRSESQSESIDEAESTPPPRVAITPATPPSSQKATRGPKTPREPKTPPARVVTTPPTPPAPRKADRGTQTQTAGGIRTPRELGTPRGPKTPPPRVAIKPVTPPPPPRKDKATRPRTPSSPVEGFVYVHGLLFPRPDTPGTPPPSQNQEKAGGKSPSPGPSFGAVRRSGKVKRSRKRKRPPSVGSSPDLEVWDEYPPPDPNLEQPPPSPIKSGFDPSVGGSGSGGTGPASAAAVTPTAPPTAHPPQARKAFLEAEPDRPWPPKKGSIYCVPCFRSVVARWQRIRMHTASLVRLLGGDAALSRLSIAASELSRAMGEYAERKRRGQQELTAFREARERENKERNKKNAKGRKGKKKKKGKAVGDDDDDVNGVADMNGSGGNEWGDNQFHNTDNPNANEIAIPVPVPPDVCGLLLLRREVLRRRQRSRRDKKSRRWFILADRRNRGDDYEDEEENRTIQNLVDELGKEVGVGSPSAIDALERRYEAIFRLMKDDEPPNYRQDLEENDDDDDDGHQSSDWLWNNLDWDAAGREKIIAAQRRSIARRQQWQRKQQLDKLKGGRTLAWWAFDEALQDAFRGLQVKRDKKKEDREGRGRRLDREETEEGGDGDSGNDGEQENEEEEEEEESGFEAILARKAHNAALSAVTAAERISAGADLRGWSPTSEGEDIVMHGTGFGFSFKSEWEQRELDKLLRILGVDLPVDRLLEAVSGGVAQGLVTFADQNRRGAKRAALDEEQQQQQEEEEEENDDDDDDDDEPDKRPQKRRKITETTTPTHENLGIDMDKIPIGNVFPCAYCSESGAVHLRLSRLQSQQYYPAQWVAPLLYPPSTTTTTTTTTATTKSATTAIPDRYRPWVVPLGWTYGMGLFSASKVTRKEFFELMRERGAVVVGGSDGLALDLALPTGGLEFFVDGNGGETRIVLSELPSIFEAFLPMMMYEGDKLLLAIDNDVPVAREWRRPEWQGVGVREHWEKGVLVGQRNF